MPASLTKAAYFATIELWFFSAIFGSELNRIQAYASAKFL
ncbi:hypothetical protein RKLH11_508 [Rhodobacteraceae bacterium KLH11]|nr:hypothetical protein RKLH11_508 [Rhodobacteraceae bacterium KLH11]